MAILFFDEKVKHRITKFEYTPNYENKNVIICRFVWIYNKIIIILGC